MEQQAVDDCVLHSPYQFNSHCSSHSTMALSVRGGHVGGNDCVCVGVCVYVSLHVIMCLYLWGLRTSPWIQIHTGGKKERKRNPHTEAGLVKAIDRQRVGAASFLFWQRCILGCCCALAKSCKMHPWKLYQKHFFSLWQLEEHAALKKAFFVCVV